MGFGNDDYMDLLEESIKIKDQALCFLASVIKSGEPWSEECEKIFREAMGDKNGSHI